MKRAFALFFAVLALSSCGGGGSDSPLATATTAVTSTPTPTPTPSPTPTSVANVATVTFDGGPAALAADAADDELVAASLADLGEAAGIVAPPVATHVQRWGGGLPQYAVGHLDRVARIRAAAAAVPGLALCGAAYDGVGIPAVIASARLAVSGLVGA